MDLFLKISVLHANFCWLGDVEEIIVLGRKVLLGKKIIQGVRGDLKARIAATGYLYGLLTTQDLNCALLEIIASLWRENPSCDLKTELFVRTE